MWLDLCRLCEQHPRPPGLRVGPVEGEADWDLDDLPLAADPGCAGPNPYSLVKKIAGLRTFAGLTFRSRTVPFSSMD